MPDLVLQGGDVLARVVIPAGGVDPGVGVSFAATITVGEEAP